MLNVDELKKLWKQVFGDEDSYLDLFFDKIYKENNTLVHYVDDKLAAALYMIPYDLCIGESHYKIMYLYALATKPEYRGKGIMTELIHQAHEIGVNRGYVASILIPANQDLFQFYKKFDYNIIYYQNKLILSRQKIESICRKNVMDNNKYRLGYLGTSDFENVYEKSILNHRDGVRQTKQLNDFYLETLQQDGGDAIAVYDKDGKMIAFALICLTDCQSENKKRLIVYETNAEEEQEWLLLLSALESNYEFSEVEVIGGMYGKRGLNGNIRINQNQGTGIFDRFITKTEYAAIHQFSEEKINWEEIYVNRLLI